MKISYIHFLVFAVVLASIASPVSASDKPKNYLALKAGIYSPTEKYDLENFNGGTRTHLDPETGFNGEIALGHYFIPALALELGVGYFESNGSPSAEPGDTKLKVVPVLATAKVLLPLGPIEPYGEFGIGAYFTRLDVHGNLSSFDGSSETTYGLHAGVGLNIDLTDAFFVGVEGRYIWAEPSFGGEDVKINGFTTTADLGFRF
jgi:opacity protein-like surface antigen